MINTTAFTISRASQSPACLIGQTDKRRKKVENVRFDSNKSREDNSREMGHSSFFFLSRDYYNAISPDFYTTYRHAQDVWEIYSHREGIRKFYKVTLQLTRHVDKRSGRVPVASLIVSETSKVRFSFQINRVDGEGSTIRIRKPVKAS